MTTLTITIPDNKANELSAFVKEKGGKVISTVSAAAIKKAQLASLKQGLTEAILIKKGELKSTPLSELWNE